jgi:hypothetical protein|tara:strand:- start:218 stop:511 length:294 start_codon:yes stop_codon:yes gene_type:complete
LEEPSGIVDEETLELRSRFTFTPEDCMFRKEFDAPFVQAVLVKSGALCRSVGALIHAVFNSEQVPGISSMIIGREKGATWSTSLNLNNGRLWLREER